MCRDKPIMDLVIQDFDRSIKDAHTLSLCISLSNPPLTYPKNCSQCQPIKEYIYRFPSQNRDLLLKKIEEHGVLKENKGIKHQGNEFMNLTCNDLNKDDFVSECEESGFGNILSKHPHIDFLKFSATDHCTHLYNLVNQSCTVVCDEEALKEINYCQETCNNIYNNNVDCDECETVGKQIYDVRNHIAELECNIDAECRRLGGSHAYCDSKGRCLFP